MSSLQYRGLTPVLTRLWLHRIAGFAAEKKPTIRPLSSWINQRARPFFPGVITISNRIRTESKTLTSIVLAQNTISSPIIGQTGTGKRNLSNGLASTATQPHTRKSHSLIDKPALSQVATVRCSIPIAPTGVSASSPLEATAVNNATQTTQTASYNASWLSISPSSSSNNRTIRPSANTSLQVLAPTWRAS
jgi:hypothetical protein